MIEEEYEEVVEQDEEIASIEMIIYSWCCVILYQVNNLKYIKGI